MIKFPSHDRPVGSGAAEGIFLRNTNETDNNAVTIFGGADDYSAAASAINFINVDHSANAGAISFDTRTTGNSYAERLRIDSSGRLLIGHSSNVTPYVASNVQVSGTDSSAALSVARYQNSASNPYLVLVKSRGGLGAATIVQDDDGLGHIAFVGADGNDLTSEGAAISAEVDGTPGQDDMPGRLIFKTTADGSNAATERLRIDSGGKILIGSGAIANPKVTTAGAIDTSNSDWAIVMGGMGS